LVVFARGLYVVPARSPVVPGPGRRHDASTAGAKPPMLTVVVSAPRRSKEV
jgi:hypothetical protein